MPSGLDPMEQRLQPLAMSIGRAVLGAAALEKVLLVDIARRRAEREGLEQRLSRELARLERRPAGALLEALTDAGLGEEIAKRIQHLIDRRNALVHRFMEDPRVLTAIASGELGAVVQRVDQIAMDCQEIVNEIAPSAFAGLQDLFGGVRLRDILEALLSVDRGAVQDDVLREQLAMIQSLSPEQLRLLREELDRI